MLWHIQFYSIGPWGSSDHSEAMVSVGLGDLIGIMLFLSILRASWMRSSCDGRRMSDNGGVSDKKSVRGGGGVGIGGDDDDVKPTLTPDSTSSTLLSSFSSFCRIDKLIFYFLSSVGVKNFFPSKHTGECRSLN